ncbi:MAG: holo-ACP synthase [Planctomycetota bacterium]|nr:holo-ACP synthase [Planctomycetota bacterium]
MSLFGIGTDITETSRVGKMIEKHGGLFLDRVYTQQEQEYCGKRKAAVQHYAGRWAAKEAILKAIGTGWSKGIHWTDIEILNKMGGAPYVKLHGQAQGFCNEKSISEILISISHCQQYATAFATALGAGDRDG